MVWLLILNASAAQETLSNAEIDAAIELGRRAEVPAVRAGGRGDFEVVIIGPVARIAQTAAEAFREYRPFSRDHVSADMRTLVYTVFIRRSESPRQISRVRRIVLQRRGAQGMEDVIEPRPSELVGVITEASFDRLPDGAFDVVVVTGAGEQRYGVSDEQRQRIR